MTSSQYNLLSCIRSSLFTGEAFSLSDVIASEAEQQAILPLIGSRIDRYAAVAQNVQIFVELKKIEEILAVIHFVVLKGMAAAVYYPEPLLRIFGDIDIIVRPEDFIAVYEILHTNGYITNDSAAKVDREALFYKNGIVIELHRSFAELNQKRQEDLLDRWIFDAIPDAVYGRIQERTFPMLPDFMNGLTLLAHISQHLESGLGLRQILDWVMYVNKALHDNDWPDFRKKTDQLGLTKLAKVTARLGQLYLGLPEENITWCMDADERLCSELLEYLFECGDFGRRLGANNTVTSIFSKGKGMRNLFINLQDDGERTWKTLNQHPYLKPFAWIYQGIRLASRGIKKVSFKELISDIRASRKRNELMEKLEATQQANRNANK